MTESYVLPDFDLEQAADSAKRLFGISGPTRLLNGERDLNYLIESDRGPFVFKIANLDEDPAMLECQHEVFELISSVADGKGLSFVSPVSLISVNGNVVEPVRSQQGVEHVCRAVNFIKGNPLSAVNPHTPLLLEKLGRALGNLDRRLDGFHHKAIERPLLWNMCDALDTLDRFTPLLADRDRSALVNEFRNKFEQRVVPIARKLRLGAIHNDANDNNIVIGGSDPWNLEIRAIIDFGDMVYSWIVAEPAIAAAYAALGKDKPLDAALSVVRGFHQAFPLTETEISVLFELMCMRLCMSVSICAYQKAQDPQNEYLRISEKPAWEALKILEGISPDFAHFCFRSACGLEPVPQSQRIVNWLKSQRDTFDSIVDVDLHSDPLLVLDTSVGSPHIDGPSRQFDPVISAREIGRSMADTDSVAAIGKYDEYRLIYSSDDFTDATGHRRTLHLGIDIFMPEGTPIYAPIDGRVMCAQNNDAPQDYGGTLILEHRVSDDQGELVFHTLYGHLKPDSIDHFRKSAEITGGQVIGEMGGIHENGNWAPHVHFEIITHMLDQTDSFVGVGTHDHRNVWLALCPDPNLMLGIPRQLLDSGEGAPERIRNEIAESRTRVLPASLSLSYRSPIHMVRGDRQYMYDFTGRKYLDAVNNVPHVGHCHPHVAEAAARQARVLNTNTRYLYRQIAQYSERLLEIFPDPLNVCFLVNSGSEANDLALRLAENYTNRKDRVILDHAYHGNLSSLIEISPYKHNGPGGTGAPSHVHTALLPDSFRGKYRSGTKDMLKKYLDSVVSSIASAREQSGTALFIAESIPGCGGQVVLPPGYLEAAYKLVRADGGLCIADEVQVGFGRVGTHSWAFETQGVIPDIVTLGKPMGNGHPLAAVVTTREIADAFNNGMEYFNTFGGNPVSCAVGNAVLDVMEFERLQQNALETGHHLLTGLAELQERFEVIGDVRGLGLYLGVELVESRDGLEPAAYQAGYIAERMKQEGILISTDGPDHNVLKIKPPMCFNRSNAEQLVSTMGIILQEDFSQPGAFGNNP